MLLIRIVGLVLLMNVLPGTSLSTKNKFNTSAEVSFKKHSIEVAGWHLQHMSNYIAVSFFIIAICIMKIVYHKVPKWCRIVTASIPESNILIIIGVIAGVIVYFVKGSDYKAMHWSLNPDLFFFILLPPIMLESAYSLYDRNFLNNLLTIVYFAVIGTVLNCLIIGFSLYAIGLTPAMGEPKLNLTIDTSLLFGSIVVAVDPVAVLAIFNEIGVNPDLYYTVFGESLFNDAVTVVLYNMFMAFTAMGKKSPVNVALGIVSLFTVSFGGLLIGIIVGALCSFISRFTEKTRIIEPMLIFASALLSYYLADLVAWSGIMSIISCGLVQAAYCFDNISQKSKTTVKYFSKVMASVSEGIIFLFLGLELVTKSHHWHWGFALWSITLCIVARFLVVFISSTLRNLQLKEKATKYKEMFIIAFGGLRGAVAFALAATIDKDALSRTGIEKDLYITTTLFIIMFTCFVMGLLMKPAVRLMRITMGPKDDHLSVFFELNNHMTDHIATGIEDVIGRKGNNYFRTKLDHFSENYIRPCLQRKVHRHSENIINMYYKVALEIHLATINLSSDEKETPRTTKLTKNLRKQIDEFSGSPEEFQKLARPNYAPINNASLTAAMSLENNEERAMSFKELRAAMKVMTLTTPTRNKSIKAYHERINRTQQTDENDSLAEEVEQLNRLSFYNEKSVTRVTRSNSTKLFEQRSRSYIQNETDDKKIVKKYRHEPDNHVMSLDRPTTVSFSPNPQNQKQITKTTNPYKKNHVSEV